MDGYGVCFLSDEFELYVKKWRDQLAATDSHHPAMNTSDERFVQACVLISVKGNCPKKRTMLFLLIFWKNAFMDIIPELI